MPNLYGAPEIDVQTVNMKLENEEPMRLLDVREPWEYSLARIEDERVVFVPLSRMIASGPKALPEELKDPEAEIIVICHHGVRSAQVTLWLMQMGYKNIASMDGGLDAYANSIDPSIGKY